MSPSAFHLNREFLAGVNEKIRLLRNRYGQDERFSRLFFDTCPVETEQLVKIVDTAYWASQTMEEGHQNTLSIVLRNRELSSNTFSFDSALPLTSKNLVKLGSALESSFSDICVCPSVDGQLKIWGLRMRSPNHLTTDLWLQVLGPGNVLIICYGRSIAALLNNQAVFVDTKKFIRTIIPKIFSNGAYIAHDSLKFYRFNTLLYIAQAMRAHRRGGTLLVVPEKSGWRNSIGQPVIYTGGSSLLEPRFTSEPPPDVSTFQDLLNYFKDSTMLQDENFTKIRLQILDQCNSIGRLTAIDGALVMTYDRYVHCFGAKIQAVDPLSGAKEVRVIKPVEDDPGTTIIFSDIGGTRHSSAAQFAHDQPGSIAIVASQDGNVSLFTTDVATGELLVIQRAELALMNEGISKIIWNLTQFLESREGSVTGEPWDRDRDESPRRLHADSREPSGAVAENEASPRLLA